PARPLGRDTAARLQEATQQLALAAEPATLTVQALPPPTTSTSSAASSAPPAAAPSAASVACFRETLVLDASSGFGGGSHDSRTSLEFDLDRLVASEPGLGGAWGRRFLERLLALPRGAFEGEQQGREAARRGSMAGRRRSTAAARAAALALAYPESVERSYSSRTGTATLSTARYGSREANRKLLLEHYAALLQAAALAAAQRGGGRVEARA
ncbi:hypothetical protein TSOC_005063, partial [Tetrabaena socialis]